MRAILASAARQIVRHPLSSAISIAIVGFAVLTATIGYAVMHSVLLRPLPFSEPDRLAVMRPSLEIHRRLRTDDLNEEKIRADESPLILQSSYVRLGSLTEQQGAAVGRPEIIHYEVSDTFFTVFGVSPLLGRVLTESDAQAEPRAAVLGYQLWRNTFGGNEKVVGTVVDLESTRLLIVGVMRPTFAFPVGANLWTAVAKVPAYPPSFVKLREGATLPQLAAAFPRLDVYSVERLVRPTASNDVIFLFGAGILVFAVACVQLLFLNVARAVATAPQIWVRKALGATQSRLVGDLAAHALLVSGAGVAAAWVLIPSSLDVVGRLLPATLTRGQYLAADWRAFAFSAALALAVAAASVWVALRLAQRVTLGHQLGGVLGHSHTRRFTRTLLVAQLAATTTLLFLCALTIQSMVRISNADLGIDADQVLLARLPAASTAAGRRVNFDEVEREMRAVPNVSDVARGATFPLARGALRGTAALPGVTAFERITVRVNYVTPAFFRTLGMRIVRGESFSDPSDTKVAVINEAFAAHLAPHGDVLGELVQVTAFRGRVIGIASNAVDNTPEIRPDPQIYLIDAGGLGRALFVRTSGNAVTAAALVRKRLSEMLQTEDVSVELFREYAKVAIAPHTTRSLLVSSLAIVGLLMSTMGVAAAMALNVRQQQKEIGLRLALGADRRVVRRRILAHALRTSLLGISGGLAIGVAAALAIQNVFFSVSPINPPAAILVALLVALVALLAAAIPATRAANVDPSAALRQP
jgi:putative ABC transport system permease protein